MVQLAWWGGRRKAMPPQLWRGVCNQQCVWSNKAGTQGFKEEMSKTKPHKNASDNCLVLDDQFAYVPMQVSPARFLVHHLSACREMPSSQLTRNSALENVSVVNDRLWLCISLPQCTSFTKHRRQTSSCRSLLWKASSATTCIEAPRACSRVVY